MRELGISVYPIHAKLEENLNYIKLAHKYGFKRIFTCLLSVDEEKDKIVEEFKQMIDFANSLDMYVIADVSPRVFKTLNISYKDLLFFKEIGAYGLRLDIGFSGLEESIMTFNPYDLKIEVNMSSGTKYIDNIISYNPNRENLMACHNFYPHRYTGLSYNHFIKTSKQFKDLSLRTAAFVSSKDALFGPWPVDDGLSTLEIHRDLPIEVQAKHFFATEVIDDVIIANAFASEEELKKLSEINKNILTLDVELVDNIPSIEKKIVLEEPHFRRGDVSEYMIRSTQSRVKYKGHKFEIFNVKDIKRGDIIIDTSLYGHYAGELQVALKDMKNLGRTNIVGKISREEIFLIDYIDGWKKFKFKEK